jgi:hypothetical protein
MLLQCSSLSNRRSAAKCPCVSLLAMSQSFWRRLLGVRRASRCPDLFMDKRSGATLCAHGPEWMGRGILPRVWFDAMCRIQRPGSGSYAWDCQWGSRSPVVHAYFCRLQSSLGSHRRSGTSVRRMAIRSIASDKCVMLDTVTCCNPRHLSRTGTHGLQGFHFV